MTFCIYLYMQSMKMKLTRQRSSNRIMVHDGMTRIERRSNYSNIIISSIRDVSVVVVVVVVSIFVALTALANEMV